jgi:hypothetical protein
MFNMSEEAFKNTIPMKVFRNGTLDIEALREQGNSYGQYIEANPNAKDDPQRPFEDNFFQETPVTPPAQMTEMMVEIQGPLMQFLSGQLAPLMGQSDEHNETAKGISILRDQALGLMSLVWTPFCNWYGEVMVDAIRCGAQNRREGVFTTMVNVPDKEKEEPVDVNVDDLRDGDIMAAPVVDANFPESWTSKSNRFFGLFQVAPQNPLLLRLMQRNPVLTKDMIGLEDMDDPDAESTDKQVEEISRLIKSSPIPPSGDEVLAALQQQAEQSQAAIEMMTQAGFPVPPAQAGQEPGAPPQMPQHADIQATVQKLTRSSVEVDAECDNHQVEAEECLRWINSPTGQKMKYSPDKQEQLGYQNVRLHFLEHLAIVKQAAQQAAMAAAPAGAPAGGAPAQAGAAGAA